MAVKTGQNGYANQATHLDTKTAHAPTHPPTQQQPQPQTDTLQYTTLGCLAMHDTKLQFTTLQHVITLHYNALRSDTYIF